jgi:hypothetical protein
MIYIFKYIRLVKCKKTQLTKQAEQKAKLIHHKQNFNNLNKYILKLHQHHLPKIKEDKM